VSRAESVTNGQSFHLAQVNIGRMLAPLDDPLLAGFVARLDEINQLADASPGFVWRYQTDAGNATSLRPYDDDRILFNLSVWETLEHLRQYVYRSQHSQLIARRKDWFTKFDGPYYALWWVPAGHLPGVEEAKQRLELLRTRGESEAAFSFKQAFPAPSTPIRDIRGIRVRF
jgi:hypothetical protein